MGDFGLGEGAAILNSLIWESHGWTQSPAAGTFKVPPNLKIKVPIKRIISEKFKLFFKDAFDPKVQVPLFYPHGQLPKTVVAQRLRKKYTRCDRYEILKALRIRSEILYPFEILFRDKIASVPRPRFPGPLPYLDLSLFDDTEMETRIPEEWMATAKRGNIEKTVPALAFLPNKYRTVKRITFDWQEVAVFRYCPDMDRYLVRRIVDCPEQGVKEITMKLLEKTTAGPFDDIWVPRIYLSFHSEDPFMFARRLASAVSYRHKIEESLRFCFYVDCMPVDDLPTLPESFIESVFSIVHVFTSKLRSNDWIEDRKAYYVIELQRAYQRNLNSQIYETITSQPPCLMKEIPMQWHPLPRLTGYKVRYSFKKRMASFINKTYYMKQEIIDALILVRQQMLVLLDKQLYNIPLPCISPIDEFVAVQRRTLDNVTEYVHTTWLQNVTNCIKEKLINCGKGHYYLQEDDWYVYQCSKLKHFMTVVSFMMQDTTRTLVIGALRRYTELITEACCNIIDLPTDFVWTESFDSMSKGPKDEPLFQVEAALKSIHLEYASDLEKYHDLVIQLFNDALDTITFIEHPEKYSLINMLVAERRILESVGAEEAEVIAWRNLVVSGMGKAIIVMEAYARAYDSALSKLAVDQITYIKNCERQKKKYNELKELIEYHMAEKTLLSETIPDYIDIGPFRVLTRSVKLTAVKKHETLAEALLGYFSSKLREHMEDINQKFIYLQEQIRLPSGSIEYLLEQVKWFETVPDEIEELSQSVKQLRKDYKSLAEFYCAFNDSDFSLYWEVIGLPYQTTVILEQRIANISNETEYLRTLLLLDQEQLTTKLEELTERITGFSHFLDVGKSSFYYITIRKTRKEIENCLELGDLYNMREKLFEIEVTSYEHIKVVSNNLEPYELLWFSISEFYKWRERESDPEIQIEEDDLQNAIEESYVKLCRCIELFVEPSIKDIIMSVKAELEGYRESRFGIKEE